MEGPVLTENSSRLEPSVSSASCSHPWKGSSLVYTLGPLCLSGVPRAGDLAQAFILMAAAGHSRNARTKEATQVSSVLVTPAALLSPHVAGTRVASEHPLEVLGPGELMPATSMQPHPRSSGAGQGVQKKKKKNQSGTQASCKSSWAPRLRRAPHP